MIHRFFLVMLLLAAPATAQTNDRDLWSRAVTYAEQHINPAPSPAAVDEAIRAALVHETDAKAESIAACIDRASGADRASASAQAFDCAATDPAFDVTASIRWFLTALDRHAVYLDAADHQRLAEQADATIEDAPPRGITTRFQDGLLIIDIRSFEQDIAASLDMAIAAAHSRGSGWRGLIVDLRGNGGGLLDVVSAIARRFVGNEQPMFRIRGRDARDNAVERGARRDSTRGRPIIVLVDNATAMGAEILTYVLRERRAARVLGQPTSGMVSIRTVLPIDTQHAIIATTHRVESANGTLMGGMPIIPDRILTDADGDWINAASLALSAATPAPPRR
jgi:hypothetical protein